MWHLTSSWQRGLAPLLLLLGLVRLAAAQAPSFDQAVTYGTPTSSAASSVQINALASDGQGNIIITGSFYGTVSFGGTVLNSPDGDIFVAKRTAAGAWLWLASGGGTGFDSCVGIATDALGKIYVTGTFGGGTGRTYTPATFGSTTLTSTGGQDVLVAKLDGNTGQWLWATSAGAGTANGSNEAGTALVVDTVGGLLLTGTFADFRLLAGGLTLYQVDTGTNLFVARLNAATGTWNWATNPGSAGASSLAVDSQGNGYLSGSFSGASLILGSFTLTNPRANTYADQGFVAKFNTGGTWQWANALDATSCRCTYAGAGGAYGWGMAMDAQGHLYLCGSFSGATATFGSTTLTNASTTYQGPQTGNIQLSDAFVARLDASTGAWQWAVRAGGTDGEIFRHMSVRNGQVVVSGRFGRNANTFDPGTPSPAGSLFGTTTLVSAGRYDAVIASLTDIGIWQWAVRAGGNDFDDIAGLAIDASNRVQGIGWCEAAAQFGPFNVDRGHNILTGLSGGVLAANLLSITVPFTLYPNPARTAVTLTGLPASQPVQVYDVLGRLVLSARTPAQGPLELALPPGLAPGVYVVRAAEQARQLAVE